MNYVHHLCFLTPFPWCCKWRTSQPLFGVLDPSSVSLKCLFRPFKSITNNIRREGGTIKSSMTLYDIKASVLFRINRGPFDVWLTVIILIPIITVFYTVQWWFFGAGLQSASAFNPFYYITPTLTVVWSNSNSNFKLNHKFLLPKPLKQTQITCCNSKDGRLKRNLVQTFMVAGD